MLNSTQGLSCPGIQGATHFSPQKPTSSTTKFQRKESQAEQTKSCFLLDDPSKLRQGDRQAQYW